MRADRPDPQQWSLRRWVGLAAVVLVAVFGGAVAAGALAISGLIDARVALVDRIDPAVQQALRVDLALADQETSVRGYALTGRDDFLEPYRSGALREAAAMGALTPLIQEMPEAAAAARRVAAAAVAWRTDYAEPAVAAVRDGRPVVGAEAAAGKARFDEVREAMRDLQGTLEAARIQGRDSLSGAATTLVVVCVAMTLVLLVVFVLVTLALRAAVAGPVARLAADVRRVVADDDFAQELRVGGPRELAELAGDIDSMRRRILAEVAAQRVVNTELDVRTEDLKRSNAELEQFAYVASHDLQEPLRKVASFCQLLQRRYSGELDERADQYIGFAVDGAKRMQVLINDLLAFSRVGRQNRERGPVDLGAAAAQAAANLSAAVEEAGAVVEVGELPVVHGEEVLLTAVLQNLIGNAVKFRGEEPPRVSITARRDGDQWDLLVADNGIGVREEYAERVFAIFQRLHGKEDYPGTGIGLAMCRKIVEHHGGRIWIEPSERGTRVRFTLPVADPTRLAPAPGGTGTTPETPETS
ncbi:sensor histidine kinase [Actinokineospora pegani]|uniref:sensor histidine kinase n=1 Tax=Actinokineospora pegani TaxID=2654637 RepID=UPI0012EA3687|nr:sensor histidine kinase [Actinokineospora pegani]